MIFPPEEIGQGSIPGGPDKSKYYVWPDDDFTYVKMIRKHGTNKYPHGFRILGTRFHPVGDFDRDDVRLPDEPLRIYKTMHGWRVFFTGRYNVDLDRTLDEFDSMGGDPVYSEYARLRKYFAMRIDPKVIPAPYPSAVARFVGETGEPRPEWMKLISMHDRLVNAHDPTAILV